MSQIHLDALSEGLKTRACRMMSVSRNEERHLRCSAKTNLAG